MESVIVIVALCMGFTLYAMPFGITEVGPDEFFLMNRSAKVKQYNDTTVAYSTQVAVTIYFFFFGFKYGESNIFFIFTWFAGLLAFGLCSHHLAQFINNPKFDGSLFSLVSNSSAHLRALMGVLFIVSLVGLLFTEVYLTAEFVEHVTTARLNSEPFHNFYFWVSFGFLALAVLWYCSLGGMRKVVSTDTWQLSIAYIGIAIFVAALAPAINQHLGTSSMWKIEFGMFTLFILMLITPTIVSLMTSSRNQNQKVRSDIRYRRNASSAITSIALLISALICLFPALALPVNHLVPTVPFPDPISSMWREPFGWAPIFGFTVINLIWQFSDYTAYHRLALLDLPSEETQRAEKIRESIFSTMLNSPITWGVGIFAGMAVKGTGILPSISTDVFNDFVTKAAQFANMGNDYLRIALIGISAFLGSVMLSTVDTGFMSVALIIVRDILKRPLSRNARIVVNIAVIFVMMSFAMLLEEMKIDILIFLNAVYSWGLIFGGIALAAMFGKRVHQVWIYISLASGAAIGAISTTNPFGLPDLVALVFPSVAAIVISGAVVFVAPAATEVAGSRAS